MREAAAKLEAVSRDLAALKKRRDEVRAAARGVEVGCVRGRLRSRPASAARVCD